MELLKEKIIKLLSETKSLRNYYESSRHINSTGANCIDIDNGITIKTWCNGCKTVFVFKDGQEIGSLRDFRCDLWDLERNASDRINNEIIRRL